MAESHPKKASRALDGIRVLALEVSVSGPHCSRILGDMGAEVIKVEKPGTVIREMESPVGPVPVMGSPLRLSDSPARFTRFPPWDKIPSRFFKNSATPRPRSTGSAEIESFSKRLVPVPAFQHSRSPLPE